MCPNVLGLLSVLFSHVMLSPARCIFTCKPPVVNCMPCLVICCFINMARDNILCFKLPYYSVPIWNCKKDFGIPLITKADYINNDFLDDVKNLSE